MEKFEKLYTYDVLTNTHNSFTTTTVIDKRLKYCSLTISKKGTLFLTGGWIGGKD